MKKAAFFLMVVLFCIVLLPGCLPIPDFRKILSGDFSPPLFLEALSPNRTTFLFEFNEPVSVNKELVVIEPSVEIKEIVCKDGKVEISFHSNLLEGLPYKVMLQLSDNSGNKTQIAASIYGYNSRPPLLLINELRLEGTSTKPDIVELIALKGGLCAGLSMYNGTPGEYESKIVFPSIEIKEGELIVVHFKPEGIPAEINEVGDSAASGGIEASSAYDLWVLGGTGLSATTGIITLNLYPGGPLLDCFVYSNRADDTTDSYLGFGSLKNYDRVLYVHNEKGWIFEGDPAPSQCFNPTDSTSTRTVCRSYPPVDQNLKSDWHIVPTGKNTVGQNNSNEVYLPN